MPPINVVPALRNLSKEITELDLGCEVQHVSWPLTPLQFHREFVSRNKPCLLTGMIHHWSALTDWNIAHLADKLRNKEVIVAVTPDGKADAVRSVSAHNNQPYFVLPAEQHMLMTDFLEHLSKQHHNLKQQQNGVQSTKQQSSNTSHNGAEDNQVDARQHQQEIMYIQQQNGNFTTHFPELADDVDSDLPWATEAFGAEPDAVNLWIGNDQSVTSFHKDHYENLYAVITGEKTFTLLPPCDAYRMHLAQYPVASWTDTPDGLQIVPDTSSGNVLWSPVEDLSNAPRSKEQRHQFPIYFDPELPKPLRVTVRAGEVLFLPSLWWHQVEQKADAEGLAIAVNYWYDMAFDCKYAYFKMIESLAVADINSTRDQNHGNEGSE